MNVAALRNAKPTKMENVISELAVGAGGKIGLCRKRLGEGALGDVFGLLGDVSVSEEDEKVNSTQSHP